MEPPYFQRNRYGVIEESYTLRACPLASFLGNRFFPILPQVLMPEENSQDWQSWRGWHEDSSHIYSQGQ